MIGKKLRLIIFFSFISLFLISIFSNIQNAQKENYLLGINNTKGIHDAIFYDERLFFEGVKKAEEKFVSTDHEIAGGITPHDFLPGYILSDFYKKLSNQNVETVILIGPNHSEKGSHKFLTSFYDWRTPFGIVSSKTEITKKLVSLGALEIDEKVLPNDHAVVSSLPYIKYYLPDAKVVPILISGFADFDEVRDFSDHLSPYINEKTVVVAAVDFSHYLTSEKAQENDKMTFEQIKSKNYERIFNLNNSYIDSPASIALVMMVMDNVGKTNMEVLHNTNSGILQNEEYIETTSYFSIVYY